MRVYLTYDCINQTSCTRSASSEASLSPDRLATRVSMQAGEEEGAGAGGAGWSGRRVSFGLFDPLFGQPAATDAPQAHDSLAMGTHSAWGQAERTDVLAGPQAGAGARQLGSGWAAGQAVSDLSVEGSEADQAEGRARGGNPVPPLEGPQG